VRHHNVDQPLDDGVERDVAGIDADLNEQFIERKILRRALERMVQYRSQIEIYALHSRSSDKPPPAIDITMGKL
jgi:hypothetical protein